MPHAKFTRRIFLAVIVTALCTSLASARPLKLFVIGNSFSNNATRYLPELAKAGGHELVIVRAQVGGCSLERHWNALAAHQADPLDPAGKFYAGKSLPELLGDGAWDVITIQQYSLLSGDLATYRPFAKKLRDALSAWQPSAEIVVHQTWAYRSDAANFGQIDKDRYAVSEREMWKESRAAYRQIAGELGARIIPTGDAFWQVDSDPVWGYKPDAKFDYAKPRAPALPDQNTSLHVGYRWAADGKFGIDTHHANAAGEYLGALVWYGLLFNESPEKLTFVPKGVAPEFARHLRQVAWTVVRDTPGTRTPVK